jgi:Inner membrane component of T3SS, cytoplasmic domain
MNEHQPALERFRTACGLNVSLVLEYVEVGRSTAVSATRAFDYPFVLVGRDPRSDLFLDDEQVSQLHVLIHAVADRILVIDFQSRTTVYWEGEEPPRSRRQLHPNRFIQVGPYRVRCACRSACENQDGV